MTFKKASFFALIEILKIDSEFPTENFENDHYRANKNNTFEFEWSSSYKKSDFNLHNLPSRVFQRCMTLDILELEYLFRGTRLGKSRV